MTPDTAAAILLWAIGAGVWVGVTAWRWHERRVHRAVAQVREQARRDTRRAFREGRLCEQSAQQVRDLMFNRHVDQALGLTEAASVADEAEDWLKEQAR